MEIFDVVKDYIKPELLVVAIALYFIAAALKNTELIKSKFIPVILGILGIIISAIYVVATSELNGYQSILMAIFTAIVQGILVAGISVYVNQVIKQLNKEE